jgi:hypothetical protein
MKLKNSQNKSDPKETKKTIIYFSGIMSFTIIISIFIIFFNQTIWMPNSSGIIQTIVDGNIRVNEKSYIFYDFSVPSPSFNLKGNFTILENRDGVISVYVMDEYNLYLWINSKNPSMYFNSGKVNSGEINVQIPYSGLFFLVFDNLSSEIQNSINVKISYFYIPS